MLLSPYRYYLATTQIPNCSIIYTQCSGAVKSFTAPVPGVWVRWVSADRPVVIVVVAERNYGICCAIACVCGNGNEEYLCRQQNKKQTKTVGYNANVWVGDEAQNATHHNAWAQRKRAHRIMEIDVYFNYAVKHRHGSLLNCSGC